MKFQQTRLDNGLQILAELNPHVHSVAMGFFVRVGSRDETPEVSGVSHFLEHMAFKGTDDYTADDVNRIFDEIGARYNASTSEEVTMFYGAILPEYLPRMFELLAAILFPSLRETDFDLEKNVILEEIGMYEDQPSFIAYEKAMQQHFQGHPLQRIILGSNESITNLSCESMRQYHADHYRSGNIVLAVAGNTDWEQILELAQKYCADWPGDSFARPVEEAQPQGGQLLVTRESSVQEQVMEMTSAPAAASELRYAAELLSVVVGDDSGSRMYWELVDTGAAEAAEIGYNDYDGSGTYLTYLSCNPDRTSELLERIHEMYATINRDGITDAELQLAKSKVSSRVVIRSERPMGRLASLGTSWIYRGEYQSMEDDLTAYQGVSLDDIRSLLNAYPLGHTTTVAVGPLADLNLQ